MKFFKIRKNTIKILFSKEPSEPLLCPFCPSKIWSPKEKMLHLTKFHEEKMLGKLMEQPNSFWNDIPDDIPLIPQNSHSNR